MPGYISKALKKFKHPVPTKIQDSPHSWTLPAYGQKTQYAESEKNSTYVETGWNHPLPTNNWYTTILRHRSWPYYAGSIGDIAATQAKATKSTRKEIDWLLDYAASHPDAKVTYRASNMILRINSDASYLSVPRARSRVGGHFFLSDSTNDSHLNGPIHSLSKILKNVVSSAAEAEITATFENCKEAVMTRQTLEEMGHPKPPTSVQVDNSTTHGFVNEKIKIKRTKAIDMRYHWIIDRKKTGAVLFLPKNRYWKFGRPSYQTSPPSHHRHMRPIILHDPQNIKIIQ